MIETGSIGIQFALNDERISLLLCAICLVGLNARELYLLWLFKGTPPPLDAKVPRCRWRGNVIHALLVAVVWLVVGASEGPLTLRSVVFALANGLALLAWLWWQQTRSSAKRRTANRAS